MRHLSEEQKQKVRAQIESIERVYQYVTSAEQVQKGYDENIRRIRPIAVAGEILLLAILKRNFDLMKAVIKVYPEHINFFGFEGERPLHLAVSQGNKAMVEWLINQEGLRLDLINKDGKRPMDLHSGSKIIDRMLLLKFLNPHLREPISGENLDQLMFSISSPLSPQRVPVRNVRRLSPTSPMLHDKKKVRVKSPVKTLEKEHLDKKGIRSLIINIYSEKKCVSDEDVQWVLMHHRVMFFEHLSKADQREDYQYLKQFDWLKGDEDDLRIFKKAQELAFASSSYHPVIRDILKTTSQPLVSSWANDDASLFLQHLSEKKGNVTELKSVCDVDPKFASQIKDGLMRSDRALGSLIGILDWVVSWDNVLVDTIVSQLNDRASEFSDEDMKQLIHSAAFKRLLVHIGDSTSKKCFQLIHQVPQLKEVVQVEIKAIDDLLQNPREKQSRSDFSYVYFQQLMVKFFECDLDDSGKKALLDLSDVLLISEDGSSLYEIIRLVALRNIESCDERQVIGFLEKYPHWASTLSYHTGLIDCFKMIKISDTDSLMHQCLYYQFQAIKGLSSMEESHIHQPLLNLTAKILKVKASKVVSNIMAKWCSASTEPVIERVESGQCYISWSFNRKPDRAMKKKLPQELRLGKDQYESAIRCILQKVRISHCISDSFEISVNESKKGTSFLKCGLSLRLILALLDESNLQQSFNDAMRQSEIRSVEDWLIRNDVPGFLSAIHAGQTFSGEDYGRLHLSLYLNADSKNRLEVAAGVASYFRAIDQRSLDEVVSHVLSHMANCLMGLVKEDQDGSPGIDVISRLKAEGLQKDCLYSDHLHYLMAVFKALEELDVVPLMESSEVILLIDNYVNILMTHGLVDAEAKVFHRLGVAWKQDLCHYLSLEKVGLTGDGLLKNWDLAVAFNAPAVGINVAQWQYIATHRGKRKGYNRELIERLLFSDILEQASLEEKSQIFDMQQRMCHFRVLVKMAQVDGGVYSHLLKRLQEGGLNLSPKKLSKILLPDDYENVITLNKARCVLRSAAAEPERRPFSLWSPNKARPSLRELAKNIRPIFDQLISMRDLKKSLFSMDDRSIACHLLWQASIELGDKHPLRQRIVHEYMVRVLESDSPQFLDMAIHEIDQFMKSGFVSRVSVPASGSILPHIGDLTDDLMNMAQVRVLVLYLGEVMYQSGDAYVCQEARLIRELRNQLAHSPKPQIIWEGVLQSGQYPSIVNAVKVLWEATKENTLRARW